MAVRWYIPSFYHSFSPLFPNALWSLSACALHLFDQKYERYEKTGGKETCLMVEDATGQLVVGATAKWRKGPIQVTFKYTQVDK